jgi:hypothetical protein
MVFLLSLSVKCFAQGKDGWELKKDKEGIQVYSRPDEHSAFNDLKVEMTLQARMSSLAALLLDVTNYPSWAFNTEKTSLLKTVGPSELYYYTLIRTPWPVANRDLPVHLVLRQDAASGDLFVRAECIPGLIPPKKDFVRVPFSLEQWRVTPQPGGKIRIVYQIRIDPGSSIPAWLVNIFAAKGPYDTFYHLREQIQKPQYANAHVSFIREP